MCAAVFRTCIQIGGPKGDCIRIVRVGPYRDSVYENLYIERLPPPPIWEILGTLIESTTWTTLMHVNSKAGFLALIHFVALIH